jgi:hypothetical protein
MKDEFGSLHADFRLLQRTHEFDKSLTELWDEGITCEVKHHGYDEARVVPSHEIALLVEDGQVVTVLDSLHNVTIEDKELDTYLDGVFNDGN